MKKLLFLAWTLAISIWADDLMIIRGGREIRGRILEETPNHISFYTDYGKKIQVHKSRISVITRKGAVLAVNPAVGTLVGIKAESDIAKDLPKSGKGNHKTPQASIPENTAPQTRAAIEPVTENSKTDVNPSREVASTVVSENIPGSLMGFRVGPVLGMTQSKASSGTPTSNRIGAEAGVSVEMPFLAGLFLQPELLLSQAGYKTDSATVKFNYIKVPILLKYHHPLNEQFSVAGFVGPYLGFRTEAKSEEITETTDIKSTTKSTLMGLDFGLGSEYALSPKLGIFLNLRYSLQVNNLDTTIGSTTATRLRQLSFLSGVLFNL